MIATAPTVYNYKHEPQRENRMESGLYWWRDKKKPQAGWTIVHVYSDGQTSRYKFIGIERSFEIKEIGSGEFGTRLNPPK